MSADDNKNIKICPAYEDFKTSSVLWASIQYFDTYGISKQQMLIPAYPLFDNVNIACHSLHIFFSR